eukprot:884622-Amphidinium_carterae.1
MFRWVLLDVCLCFKTIHSIPGHLHCFPVETTLTEYELLRIGLTLSSRAISGWVSKMVMTGRRGMTA